MDLLAPLLAWNSMEVHYNHDCQNLGLLATNICRCLLLDVGVGYISYISGWWVCWKNNQLAEHAGSTRLDLPLSHCISISHEIWVYIQYEESKQTWRSDHIFLDGEAISIVYLSISRTLAATFIPLKHSKTPRPPMAFGRRCGLPVCRWRQLENLSL